MANYMVYPRVCSRHPCKKFLFNCFWIMDISIKSSWSNVLYSASVSLLIFSLDSLLIDISGVLDFFILLCCHQFPCFLCEYMFYVFRCSYAGCIYIYNCYSLWLDHFSLHNALLCLLLQALFFTLFLTTILLRAD